MPVEWTSPDEGTHNLRLWPYRSLPPNGFAWFIGVTAALVTLPLLAVIATPVFWGLLPFILLALAGIWFALKRSWADHAITEELTLTVARITLTRHGPRGRVQTWEANPFWVEVLLRESGGPVPLYLTLRGEGREVELGPFLTPQERRQLAGDLRAALARVKTARN